ncbi:hypothetical protein [Streptomyces sp. NPDC002855]|uniref:hypothetical protein n=1 Tax=Streptomyces sp. NPDC002855 TaxID=3154437 RepID=UPI00332DE516
MNEYLRTATLATAAALRGDETAVRLLLRSLPAEHGTAACEGALLAMAELVREAITPEAVENAVRAAQALAQQAVTEGEPR